MTSSEHDPLVGYLETWVELRACTAGQPCIHSADRFTARKCARHVRAHRAAMRWARLRRRRLAEMCGTSSMTLDESHHR